MNKKILRMLQEIEQRGGMISMSGSIPDDVAEQFLTEVLSCPDCFGRHQNAAERQRHRDTGVYSASRGSGVRPRKGH